VLVGSGSDRVNAPGQHLQGRAVAALDQGEKPEVARDASCRGRQLVTGAFFSSTKERVTWLSVLGHGQRGIESAGLGRGPAPRTPPPDRRHRAS
jgi:hypothetical protein